MLNLKDTIVTIDAMGTQRAIARQIIQQEGHHILAVKGNQGRLHDEIREAWSGPASVIMVHRRTLFGAGKPVTKPATTSVV